MKITKEQFEAMLKTHDWYYHNSDSMKVYDKGRNTERFILALAKSNEEFNEIYLQYKSKTGV